MQGIKSTPNYKARDGRYVFLFSKFIFDQSMEDPLTGYLGTDKDQITFYMEWFAENFRLYVTNPDLSMCLRPKFALAMLRSELRPLTADSWQAVLLRNKAPERIVEQARKKIMKEQGLRPVKSLKSLREGFKNKELFEL